MVGETRQARLVRSALRRRSVPGVTPDTTALRRRVHQLQTENKALREQLAMITSVLDNDDEGVVMARSDSRYAYANPAAHKIFGFPPGAMLGLKPEDISPPELHMTLAELPTLSIAPIGVS